MPEVLMGVSLLVLFVQLLDIPLGFTTLIIAHTTFCFPFVLAGVHRGSTPSWRRPRWTGGRHRFRPFGK
ncbi:MAG: hypothetical protein WC076_07765 [Terrimicrobiaceae bacterium]